MTMELILKETISTLGREGDIVKVKPGYGRNYLLPQGKAVPATKENKEILERDRAEIEARLVAQRKDAEGIAGKIDELTLTIEQLAGEDERLFGSVTSTDICEKLKEHGVELDKRQIVLNDPIKALGDFTIPVKLGFEVNSTIKLKVVTPETSEEVQE